MIRVVIVEDETLVRRGIRGLLGLLKDIEVVAEAADGEEAIDVIQRARPDVVLMDVRMPKRSGPEVLEAIQSGGNVLPPVILLTTFDDDEVLLRGIRAGARGFLVERCFLGTTGQGDSSGCGWGDSHSSGSYRTRGARGQRTWKAH